MKITFILLVIIGIGILFSCSNKTKKEGSKTIMVDPNELTPGPIQHNELSESQMKKIKSIHKTFEEVYPITLEETITNFKRDHNIDKEINLWLKMKETFITVMNNKKYEKVEKRKETFKIILMNTMISKKEVENNIKIKELSEDDTNYILNTFENQMNK